ncbi:MAG: S41 family peptidase, partial [Verrucomicrobia bacterium]|nr:S41 family peptidase [Verrucomicrobiota bacterium]
GGFGFTISRRDQEIVIISTMEGSPSARAGILPGDQLIAIDDRPTAGMSVEELNRRLQARPDQQVTLTIYRATTKETKTFPLHRELFKVASVVDCKILDQNEGIKIGYVRITEFTEPTAQELADRLGVLEAQGMQALILDLRFNPGGLLTSAVDVSGLFVPPRTMVAYTEGRDPAQRNEYFTDIKSGHWQSVPIAVLTNGSSASAAEIVTGALKDLKRAVVVGETTFGKGVVQSQIPLPDGSAMLLTTAKYYTPGRQVIQEKGITPDIKVSLDEDQERAVALRQRGGSFTPEEQQLVAKAQDAQLNRAADALHGLIIYREEVK